MDNEQAVELADRQEILSVSDDTSKASVQEEVAVVVADYVTQPTTQESTDSTKASLEEERVKLEQMILAIKQKIQDIGPNYMKAPHLRASLSEESKKAVRELLLGRSILAELKELIEAAKPPPPSPSEDEERPPGISNLIIGKIIQRWSLVALTTEGLDPEKDWSQIEVLLGHIKALLKDAESVDSGLCAFWIANLTEVVSGMHHFIINATSEESSSSPVADNESASPMVSSFGKVAWAVPVVTARQKIVKFVEDVLGLWLSDLYAKLCHRLKNAIMEDDGSGAGTSTSSKNVLSFLLSGGAEDEVADLSSVIMTSFYGHAQQMRQGGLAEDLTSRLIGCIFQHASTDCFNLLMRKKKYVSTKKIEQIKSNFDRLQGLLEQLPVNATLVLAKHFDPLLQTIQLLQEHQSIEDPTSLRELYPALNMLQMRRALTNQMACKEGISADPSLMQYIEEQIAAEHEAAPTDDDTGVTIEPEPARFDIAAPPKAPVPFEELPDDLPPNLQRLLMLTRETL